MQHDMARVALDFLGREHGEVPLKITQPITLLKVMGGEGAQSRDHPQESQCRRRQFHDPGKWP
jgi:hypothetical protein